MSETARGNTPTEENKPRGGAKRRLGFIGRRLDQPLVLASGFVILTLIVAFAVWLVLAVRAQKDVVVHTLDVENRIVLLLLDLRRAESAQRGYLLADDPAAEATYREAIAGLPRQLDQLRSRLADNPAQTAALETVDRLARERITQLDEVVRQQRAGNLDAALAIMRSGEGQQVMSRLRVIAEAMATEERRLFEQRSAEVDRSSLTLLVALIGGFALIIALAAFAVMLVRRSMRERDEALAVLAETNANLEETVAIRTADLQEANDEIQRFAYIVSHDLRSPLVNIMGFTSELEVFREQIFVELERLRERLAEAQRGAVPSGGAEAAGASPTEPVDIEAAAAKVGELGTDFDEALRFIKSSIAKMDRLIHAILQLSREGRREFSPETIDMVGLIGGIVDTVAHQAEASGASIAVGDLPQVISDRLALEQVFSNLIDNALKYLRPDEPGRIQINGRATLTHVTYEVTDNGRGIDPQDHKRIFELFRRSGVQDQPGEGIGLAHVRALVRRLGGTLNLTSELGQGSTFTVMLPRRPPRIAERIAA